MHHQLRSTHHMRLHTKSELQLLTKLVSHRLPSLSSPPYLLSTIYDLHVGIRIVCLLRLQNRLPLLLSVGCGASSLLRTRKTHL